MIGKKNIELSPMLLSIQMIADPLDELFWDFSINLDGDLPRLRACQLYCGQTTLSADILYVIPEGLGSQFPIDQYSYVSCDDIKGKAPHIRGLKYPFHDVLNKVLSTFEDYHNFEMRLNHIITGGGTLKDLCRIGSEFFHNPLYIHDNMFAVIAFSSRVEGMLKFEYNEKTGKLYVPLWLIDEFKFDTDYRQTLQIRHAGLWDNDQYPHTMRSLFVNLWSGNYYYGRVLINEIGTALLPGQFQAAEYFGKYLVAFLQQNEQSFDYNYSGFEDTLVKLMNRTDVDQRDLRAMLTILDWDENDRYLCVKLENQNSNALIRSDSALDSTLASILSGYTSFYHHQQLCIVINLTQSGTDPDSIRLLLAPHVRDSYMRGGISNPIVGIRSIHAGFFQTDVVLNYIIRKDSSKWLLPFSSCALSYILMNAVQELSPQLMADSAILDLQQFDAENDTQYYETLRSYLQNERNITKTADELIIHRTTLTYRLKKIDELTKLNLDDDRRRLYTLLSFYFLEEK